MTEQLDGAVIPTGFDVPVEPLRRAAHYTGEPGCIAEARAFAARFVEQLRQEWCAGIDERIDGEVMLVVSELVTNADRHSNGPYILELEGTDSTLTVSVYDSSDALPMRYPKDPRRIGRHGLEIVHALAAEVSAERVPVGKRVRALLRLGDRAALGGAAKQTAAAVADPATAGDSSGSTEGGMSGASPQGDRS